jgi:cytochrome o ubiquinol oxidase operon protein cyoD
MRNQISDSGKGTISQYVAGFVLSLAITLVAYATVQHHINTGHVFPTDSAMVAILSILAIAQLMVQLVFFLHLNRESKPRWNLLVAGFAVLVVLIVVFGSLWIMGNLNYHHEQLTPGETSQQIIQEEGIHH